VALKPGHRQVDGIPVSLAGAQVAVLDDDTPRPAICWLSLPRRSHQLRGSAVFPVPAEPARGLLAARGILVTYETIRYTDHLPL
jgi:hypothetical protein